MHYANCYAALEPDETDLDHSMNVDTSNLPDEFARQMPNTGRSSSKAPPSVAKHDRVITT